MRATSSRYGQGICDVTPDLARASVSNYDRAIHITSLRGAHYAKGRSRSSPRFRHRCTLPSAMLSSKQLHKSGSSACRDYGARLAAWSHTSEAESGGIYETVVTSSGRQRSPYSEPVDGRSHESKNCARSLLSGAEDVDDTSGDEAVGQVAFFNYEDLKREGRVVGAEDEAAGEELGVAEG